MLDIKKIATGSNISYSATQIDSGIKYKPENCETTAAPNSDRWSPCSSQAFQRDQYPIFKEQQI